MNQEKKSSLSFYLMDLSIIIGAFFSMKSDEIGLPLVNQFYHFLVGSSRFLPLYHLLFVFVAILVIIYALADLPISSGYFNQLYYGLNLIGIMFTCSGLSYLLTGNILGAMPGLLISFVLLLLIAQKSKGISGLLSTINRNSSRVFVLPIALNLFAQGVDAISVTMMEPAMAVVFLFMMYVPIRLLLVSKGPKSIWGILVMLLSVGTLIKTQIEKNFNSPSAPVWDIIKTDTGNKVLIDSVLNSQEYLLHAEVPNYYNNPSEGYYFIVTKNNNKEYHINWDKSLEFYESKKDFSSYYLKKLIMKEKFRLPELEKYDF